MPINISQETQCNELKKAIESNLKKEEKRCGKSLTTCNELLRYSNEDQICRSALAHYGPEHQINMLVEEMAEFTQAIMKSRREGVQITDSMVSEFVDVMICMEQFGMFLGDYGYEDRVQDLKRFKVNRLKERMRSEGVGV